MVTVLHLPKSANLSILFKWPLSIPVSSVALGRYFSIHRKRLAGADGVPQGKQPSTLAHSLVPLSADSHLGRFDQVLVLTSPTCL